MTNKNGRIIYEGPSAINGEPIVVIATGFADASKNTKTGGKLIQTFIMLQDVAPHAAAKAGLDDAVCGDCPHRPANNGSCYVVLHHAPLSTWRCYTSGTGYAFFDAETDGPLLEGQGVRLGSYGDPAAVPIAVWLELLDFVDFHTGYTHQWKTCDAEFSSIVMASADSLQDKIDANENGYRTFRVRPETDRTKDVGEFVCPASAERGHVTTCDACQACGGWLSKARANVVISSHGPKRRNFVEGAAE